MARQRPLSRRPLRLGFVGAGTIARDRHVSGFRAIPGVELSAVVNRNPQSSAAAAHEFGFARTHSTWQALVEDPDIDAVVIGTWPYLHAPITIAALEHGKHVLSQARMAMDGSEARAMVRVARDHPALTTQLVPASHTFWVDATLSRLLRDEAIGRVRSLDVAWNEPEIVEAGEWWRHQRRYSGNNVPGVGALYEVLVRWLGPAEAVVARSALFEPQKPGPHGDWIVADLPDHLSLLVGFGGGVQGSIEVSTHSAAGGPSHVTLLGSGGVLRVDLREHRLERAAPGSRDFRSVKILAADREHWQVEAEFVGAIRGEREIRRNPFDVGAEYMAFSDAVVMSGSHPKAMPIWRSS